MRNVVIIIVTFLLGIIALVSVMTITGRTDRQTELSANLSSAVEETVNTLLVKKQYEIADREEFIADFRENLAEVLDSDCEITVDVTGMDLQKGLLSVKVTAEYTHPNGGPGSVICERTVIFDPVKVLDDGLCTVSFYLKAGESCYKLYKLASGECAAIPKAPQSESGRFAGWYDENGNLADFSQPVTQNMTYYARWS